MTIVNVTTRFVRMTLTTMMHDINELYFRWLHDIMCDGRFAKDISYYELFLHLHSIPFRYSLLMDENRAEDGLELRHRFSYECADIENAEMYIDGPCSVLEMMVALAIRCEEDIMDDPSIGSRIQQWFWLMINNLRLGSMYNDNYSREYVDDVLNRFLDRDYEPDGRGGLFIVRNCDYDLRDVEIWQQLCMYINTIT